MGKRIYDMPHTKSIFSAMTNDTHKIYTYGIEDTTLLTT